MSEKEKYRYIKEGKIIKSWCLEPLTIATLNALTPKSWIRHFYDDRIENINYDEECDIVAITVETYTAKRAYEISKRFRDRGKKVIMGGFHVSILPEEALKYADSILIGEAEGIWDKILQDVARGELKQRYKLQNPPNLSLVKTDREIFETKRYSPITLVESGRGCYHKCEFCSVSEFFNGRFRRRPIPNIISEIQSCKSKLYMFVDDNICADNPSAKELFKALVPLKIRWASQAPLSIAQDDELLDLMEESGCVGLLIGFETLNKDNLIKINKSQNINIAYDAAIKKLYSRHIKIYASFVFGFENDDEALIDETLRFAKRHKFYIANFYQLTPFPGTKLYQRLQMEKRLIYERWWLNKEYSYGDLVFRPKKIDSGKLGNICYKCRRSFYSWISIFWRALDLKVNCNSLASFFLYFAVNIKTRTEVIKRQYRKLGRE